MAQNVTGKKARFVRALVGGQGIPDAAATADVTRRTAYRWLHEGPVQEALGKVLDAELSALAAATLGKSKEAAEVLHTIMHNVKVADYVRVSAAKALFDGGLRLFELRTLGMRLDRVEARLAEIGSKA